MVRQSKINKRLKARRKLSEVKNFKKAERKRRLRAEEEKKKKENSKK